jgi:hypothetical protein
MLKSTSRYITLQFPDINSLWSFAQTLGNKRFHITTSNKALSFGGTEAEIALAVIEFKATTFHKQRPQEQTGDESNPLI